MAVKVKNDLETKWFEPLWTPLAGSNTGFYDNYGQQKEPSKFELVKAYNDLTYNCIRLISTKLSRVRIRLYVKEKPNPSKGYAPLSYFRHKAIEKALPNYGSPVAEVVNPSNPLLRLINRGNAYHNYMELMQLTIEDLDLTGNAFWLMEKNPLGQPVELYPLPSQLMQPKRDDNYNIIEWVYQEGIHEKHYKPEQLIHFKYSNPADPYGEGYSPTRAAYARIQVSFKEVSWLDNELENLCRPDSIIAIKNDNGISPYEQERLLKEFYQRYRGGEKGPLFLEGTLNYQPLSWQPTSMADLEIHKIVKTTLCNAYQIPPDLFELGTSSNRSTKEAAIYSLMADCISPRMELLVEKLNERLVKYFDTRYFFAADNCIPEDKEFVLKELDTLFKNGAITRGELRKHYGYAQEEWADMPLLPNAMVPAPSNQEEHSQQLAGATPGASPASQEAPEDDTPKTPEQAEATATNDLRATVGGSQAILALQVAYSSGQIQQSAAIANAVLIFGFTPEQASSLFPDKPLTSPVEAPQPGASPSPSPGADEAPTLDLNQAKAKCGGEGGKPGPCPEGEKPEAPKPGASPANKPSKIAGALSNAVDKTEGLTPEQKQTYKASIANVTNAMPEEAIKRLSQNTKKVRFHATTEALTNKIVSESPEVKAKMEANEKKTGKKMGLKGAYNREHQQLDLNGATKFEGKDISTEHFHAHEMAHAIDGPQHEISNSPEWQQAWKEEIQPGQLSKYAATTPAEGFAEFGRLNYAAKDSAIQSKYPKSYAVWKSKGLV